MEFIEAVRAGLAEVGDPARAPEMQRYMKSDMPFRGVPKPERTALVRTLFAEHVFTDRADWIAAVTELWRDATYREERYVALDLLAHKRYTPWNGLDLLPLYEEMIVTGAWWDFVDELAARRVGPLVLAHPDVLTPTMRAWATDPDRWKRRTSVLCQLKARDATDTDLLTDTIESTLDDPDFFLRKAIGWALREYAKTDPGWVRHFVETHPELSPLSRREALKHL
ncbi:3-methyladenine DNA glycosylase AlkD [Actinokineospora alba]|uniref:3-methyladenine DNA glycosylase AlkD n=1 Tax=Actinokineospora alba TaxID=504798 RepID=A0A1H0VQV6_9PSEU|nr:DNA alkylation repair protein [Actinokineospora alba]TDP70149.1 3-methyladenine DNA glycosylase AlkD [Actinokineospora alba]SDI37916.1 3-methyladenine DNA glycosylase AlkD [Actinokineospora alba]SDP80962.1 3-methyladenine DNA glycosylase AlkD [Actinokineospora alba]